jgi:hypothetical protein
MVTGERDRSLVSEKTRVPASLPRCLRRLSAG